MTATFTWLIESMSCKPVEGPYTDVVVTAAWRCNGSQEAGDPAVTYEGTTFGTSRFTAPGSQFTPYASLTQDQVLGWCWGSSVDKAATEAAVQAQIDRQINPPAITLPLPWATPAA